MMADGVGSGAGTFPVLLAGMLERGHRVDVFGAPGFNEPKSLERFESYRFVPLRLPRLEWLWWRAAGLKTPYPMSLVSQLAHLGFQREAIRAVAREPGRYDLLFCADAFAMWRASVPVVSWPQSPPNSEAAALRSQAARGLLASTGAGKFAAVQLFYAYRWLCARASLGFSDVYLCGSRWARDEWEHFGASAGKLRATSYLIDLDAFANVPPLRTERRNVTFLWLGRATPRKRLDLFLEAFVSLRRRHPDVRARLVGTLRSDPYAARMLAPFVNEPGIEVEEPVSKREVPALLGDIDVLVQSSEKENFGFAVAEALAAGRPVVLGPTNGTADYVGHAGFLFAAYDAASVAEAMERAMTAALTEGPRLSDKARAAAEEHFTPRSVVDRFEDVCREVASATGSRA
jgi:glycosyltransferase involved in cell wall biosynthesis